MLAILAWRNTPSEGFSTSPVLKLMGRRTRTLLPTAENLLQPNSDLKTTARSLAARNRQQCKQYNRGTKNLVPLKVGEVIRMKLPGEQKWSLGRCSRLLVRRSYEVEDGASAETAASCAPPWSHHQCRLATMKSRTRPRMKTNNLSCQSLYQTSAKPRLLLILKRMTHCLQHTLSQTAQNQFQLTCLDAPGESDVPLPSWRIMTYAKHLNIDLNLPLFY